MKRELKLKRAVKVVAITLVVCLLIFIACAILALVILAMKEWTIVAFTIGALLLMIGKMVHETVK